VARYSGGLSRYGPAVPPGRRVLVIAYYFPPLGGAGVQRTLKFVKYLPEFGWTPAVVSTRSRVYKARDSSLVGEIPQGTRVVRAIGLPVARWLAIAFGKLGLRGLRAWVSWPDGGLGWTPFALAAAWREVRRERPDVIYSSSAPYGAHMVALALHRRTGIPWVADFRDEWAADPHLANQSKVLAALSRRVEQAITRHATRIVVVADYFELDGAASSDPRRVTITNGVDSADVPEKDGSPPPDRFRLSFIGTIYESINAAPVLDAVERLVADGVIDPERFEFRVVGNVWIPGFSPPPRVPFVETGYVSHEQAVEEMRRSTALLLYRPPASHAPSGKIFEYLAVERPILCITRPDNLAARIVSDWDAGEVAPPDDDDAIERALRAMYEQWEAGDLHAPAGTRERVLERFSRRELARRLAEVLDSAVPGSDT
jgi:glycosyltransferase involved in cell wall biosynthesis